jgi:homoisocitrate dehydrogenase
VIQAILPDAFYQTAEAGWECFRTRGTSLPEPTVEAVEAADATLFGATQSPSTSVDGYFSPILALRRRLDLYANLRPVAALAPGARASIC